MKTTLLSFISLLMIIYAHGQTFGLIDGRLADRDCIECKQILESKPKEILFGIHLINGFVYFSMTSEIWFNKIFTKATDGITADLVSKEQFACNKPMISSGKFPRGIFLKPVYRDELKNRMEKQTGGGIQIKLGPIPGNLKDKEIEGNFVIVRDLSICHYINFTNIERSLWNLLDMGLYTDSLINFENISEDPSNPKYFMYSKKVVVTVPFKKGKAVYSAADIKPLYDSLNLKGYTVKQINIRAFSSVEGDLTVNQKLQKERAQNMIKAIQGYQKNKIKTEIVSGENWVEFMKDISKTTYAFFAKLGKDDIKKALSNKSTADSLENVLSKHRKAVITLYMDPKSIADGLSDQTLAEKFNQALLNNEISKAEAIQRSVFERINDNRLPQEYMDKLEIPSEKPYSTLLNDRSVYKYLLNQIYEDDAINELRIVENLDPQNGKVKYNLCALQMRLWQYNDSIVDKNKFLNDITNLKNYSIREPLIKRMLINYHIILCEVYMKRGDYLAKDNALLKIKENFIDKSLSDRDLLSVGKFFSWYNQYQWADQILSPRMDQLDVDEDLLFFYINLAIFVQKNFQTGIYNDMLLNAISINSNRFCAFFNSIDSGGISMQLLLDNFWRKVYCENCQLQMKLGKLHNRGFETSGSEFVFND